MMSTVVTSKRSAAVNARVAVSVLNERMQAHGRVPLASIQEFYDEVLTTLALSPSNSDDYGHLSAKLHTLLCNRCPHILWSLKDRSFHWMTVAAPSATAEDESDENV